MCAPLPKVGILWPVKVSGELLVGEARAVAVEHDHHLQGVRPLDAPPRRRAAGAHLPQGERPTLGHAYSRHAGRLHMLSRAWSSALPAATWLWGGARRRLAACARGAHPTCTHSHPARHPKGLQNPRTCSGLLQLQTVCAAAGCWLKTARPVLGILYHFMGACVPSLFGACMVTCVD
jgi:hypothetical protein